MIKIEADTKKLLKELQGFREKQLPFAMSKALNQTAKDFQERQRASMREVHGGVLATKQFIQGFIADSYIDIQAARLMTIRCAEMMEDGGDPRTDISAIKIFVPSAY